MRYPAITSHTRSLIERIIQRYDPEHDIGPEAPVQWASRYNADAIIELTEAVDILKKRLDFVETEKLKLAQRVIDLERKVEDLSNA